MTIQHCTHTWGEAEECETGRGLIRTPICTQCGALKFEVDQHARRLLEDHRAARPVHKHQTQFFADV